MLSLGRGDKERKSTQLDYGSPQIEKSSQLINGIIIFYLFFPWTLTYSLYQKQLDVFYLVFSLLDLLSIDRMQQ